MFGLATVLLAAAAPLLATALSSDATTPASRTLVTTLAFLIVPSVFCYGLGAVFTAVLNARNRFAAPTWAPIANNTVIIGTVAVFLALPGPAVLTPDTITTAEPALSGAGRRAAVGDGPDPWGVADRAEVGPEGAEHGGVLEL